MRIVILLMFLVLILAQDNDFEDEDSTTEKAAKGRRTTADSVSTKKSTTTEKEMDTEEPQGAEEGTTTKPSEDPPKSSNQAKETVKQGSTKKPKPKFAPLGDDCISSPIDAITSFNNGSIFVASTKYYWIFNNETRRVVNKGLIKDLMGMESLKMAVSVRKSVSGVSTETLLFHAFEGNQAKFKIYEVKAKKWTDGSKFVLDFTKAFNITMDKEKLKKTKMLFYYFKFQGLPIIVLKLGSQTSAYALNNKEWKKVLDKDVLNTTNLESLYVPDPSAMDMKYIVISKSQYNWCEFMKTSNSNGMAQKCETQKEDIASLLPCLSTSDILSKHQYKKLLTYIVVGVLGIALVLMVVVCCVYCKFLKKPKKHTKTSESKSAKQDKELEKQNTKEVVDKIPSATKEPSGTGETGAQSEQTAAGGQKDNPDIGQLEEEMKQALVSKGTKKSAHGQPQEEGTNGPGEGVGSVKSDQNTYMNMAEKVSKKEKAKPKGGQDKKEKASTKTQGSARPEGRAKKGHYKENVKQFTAAIKGTPEKASKQKTEQVPRPREPTQEKTGLTKLKSGVAEPKSGVTQHKSGTTEQTPGLSNFMQAEGEQNSKTGDMSKTGDKSQTGDDKVKQLLSMQSNKSDQKSGSGQNADAKLKSLLKSD